MLLVLLAFILRPVGFVFRNKSPNPAWRNTWDWALTIAGAVPALVFGVAFGNLFLGAPFQFSDEMRVSYDGRSEEHTSELQSLMRISYAVFCLKKKKHTTNT